MIKIRLLPLPALTSLLLAVLAGCEEPAPVSIAAQAPAALAEAARPAIAGVERPGTQFVDGYREGFDLAAREGKPMLLFFTAEWCGFCHQMEADAFVDTRVIELSDRFVCVRIDADREAEVCRHYQVRLFPTVQFLSAQGVPLNRLTGKKSADQLLLEMHGAMTAVAKRQKAGGGTRLQ